jgi:hypothetical protein
MLGWEEELPTLTTCGGEGRVKVEGLVSREKKARVCEGGGLTEEGEVEEWRAGGIQ